MNNRSLYLKTIQTIRRERGEHCEACGIPATHGHHVIPVSETSIIIRDIQKLNEAINGNGEDEQQTSPVERAQPIGQFVDIFNDT